MFLNHCRFKLLTEITPKVPQDPRKVCRRLIHAIWARRTTTQIISKSRTEQGKKALINSKDSQLSKMLQLQNHKMRPSLIQGSTRRPRALAIFSPSLSLKNTASIRTSHSQENVEWSMLQLALVMNLVKPPSYVEQTRHHL